MKRFLFAFFAALLFGCPDPGLEPKEYCSEQIAIPANEACTIDYGVCSDSFACDVRVECATNGTTTTCHCTSPSEDCDSFDRSFESSEVCSAASSPNHTHLRALIVAGCELGSDTTFSRIPK